MKTQEQIIRAYRTLDAALAHRKAFDMDVWASRHEDDWGDTPTITLAELESECGTTACFAGWHAALAGRAIVGNFIQASNGRLYEHIADFTAEELGLEEGEWSRLFYCETDEIEEVVEKIFGPRPESAEQL